MIAWHGRFFGIVEIQLLLRSAALLSVILGGVAAFQVCSRPAPDPRDPWRARGAERPSTWPLGVLALSPALIVATLFACAGSCWEAVGVTILAGGVLAAFGAPVGAALGALNRWLRERQALAELARAREEPRARAPRW
ncbi:MAG: hypothetical protein AB7N76_36990 [Planctomycetota bacterium]